MPWLKPSLSLRWGSYTKLDGDEQAKIVESTIKAHEAGLITLRMAVEKIAAVYGIENVDAVLEALKKEAAEKEAKALTRVKAEQEALHSLMKNGSNPSGPRSGSEEEPASAPGG